MARGSRVLSWVIGRNISHAHTRLKLKARQRKRHFKTAVAGIIILIIRILKLSGEIRGIPNFPQIPRDLGYTTSPARSEEERLMLLLLLLLLLLRPAAGSPRPET